MKKLFKKRLKVYIIPLFFVAATFLFTTYAWFAYSGLKRVSADVDIQSWYIEMKKDNEVVTNNIVVTLDDIYPGMETVTELVKIQNKGDSNAALSYNIQSARIFDTNVTAVTTGQNQKSLENILSHDYPFHININLSKRYVKNNNDETQFEVSISWPLDSGNDALDSTWGRNSYTFQNQEQQRHSSDNSYSIRPSIQIVIELAAEQYIDSNEASDMTYNLGDVILYDVVQNKGCDSISQTCLSTTVLDYDSKKGDATLTLLPNIYDNYPTSTYNNYSSSLSSYTSSWNATVSELSLNTIIKVLSYDIFNSTFSGTNISPQIIGDMDSNADYNNIINKVRTSNGSFSFMNNKYSYLINTNCYWLYSSESNQNGFKVIRNNENTSTIDIDDGTAVCKVIPLITVNKSDL